ncbi:hypothetical protein [Geomonas sp.]|uniref:hypothetical protein n=1 Tax=Geomonas sp. TaxID=2651584 RepID=UPI002B46E816|nr:hypothetical protein [Geomonas sp.]HJV33451.1 hypothetical protein [Geomonas sp.]
MRSTVIIAALLAALLPAWVAAADTPPPPAGPPVLATVTGQVVDSAGAPLAGGSLQLFNAAAGPPPSQDRYWRIPNLLRPLGPDGKFTLKLREGKYYIGALKRKSGQEVGPPQAGDPFYIHHDEKGAPQPLEVKAGEQRDLGRMVAGAYQGKQIMSGPGITAIAGTVVDPAGHPVEKAVVFASVAAVGRPLFAAEPTGKDGKFLLRIADGGSFFLRARHSYGGAPPIAGQPVGTLRDRAMFSVVVKKGERLEGVTVTLGDVTAPPGQTQPQFPPMELKQLMRSGEQEPPAVVAPPPR